MEKNRNLLKTIGLIGALALSNNAMAERYTNCHVITSYNKDRMVPICAQFELDNFPPTLKAGETYTIKWKQMNVNRAILSYSMGVGQLDHIIELDIATSPDIVSIPFTIPQNLKGRKLRFKLIGYDVGVDQVNAKSRREFKIE